MAGTVYEGKTYDEAVRKGLEALRLTRAEAVITTIEEGKGGFLGIGARPFRVSVSRRPGGAIREPSERAGEDRRGGRNRNPRGPQRGNGGREERGGRGGGARPGREAHAPGRGAREKASTEGGSREGGARDSGAREGGGRERPGREPRGGRDERAGRERGAGEPRGGRASEERTRPGREPRPAREERAGRERPAAEARAPQPAAEARPERRAPMPPAPAGDAAHAAEGGDEPGRKRRRRGRRGGRGRRRGGPAESAGAAHAEGAGTPDLNGVSDVAEQEFEPLESTEPMAPRALEAEASNEPESTRMSPAHPVSGYHPTSMPSPAAWAPEPAAEPSHAVPVTTGAHAHEPFAAEPARGSALRPERAERGERGERHARHEGSGAPDMSTDELSATSRRLTEDLLKAMGFEPRVSVRAEGNRVDVTVEVDRDDDLLNGRQGETRQALQHLLNRFLNKGDGSRYHLQLEVNDFWQRREVELAELARRLAEEAVTRNAEVVSDYLNSQERRIVHMTLKEDARVKTFSLGSGMVKRVAIAPAGFPERTEDDTI